MALAQIVGIVIALDVLFIAALVVALWLASRRRDRAARFLRAVAE